jgi:hypothetical protein
LDNPKRISELIEGQNLFESSGFSLIKITKNGKEELIELPIKSTGVAEYQEKLRGNAPKPPVRKELIKKNSKEGKELGLSNNRMMQVFDTTDEAYINALEKHEQNFIWQVIIFALDIIWKKKDGSIVNTFDEKRAILKSTGITSAHSEQIFKDVQGLTQIAEDEEDFLSDK